MNKSTNEEAKEFWEGCGFQYIDIHPDNPASMWFSVIYPDCKEATKSCLKQRLEPPIDLNNLFKYAVPYINKYYGYAVCLDQVPGSLDWYCQLVMPSCSVVKTFRLCPKDPVLTLFWALYPVITGKEVIHD